MDSEWSYREFSACVRVYLWMRDAEQRGERPNKSRVRKALVAGPLQLRSEGSIEYRFQNISEVLRQRNEAWLAGYLPATNVGTAATEKISSAIDAYNRSRSSKRVDCLINALPDAAILKAITELFNGRRFEYPDSVDYEVVRNGSGLPPKKVVGYASLLHYGATLLPQHFSAGLSTTCFRRLEAVGLEIGEKISALSTESGQFRTKVRHSRSKDITLPAGNKKPKKTVSSVVVYERDPKVVAYVEERARGKCELCGKTAPFIRTDGTPFLEVHHIVPLGEDGPDTVDNAAALCPNCHRACHYSSVADRHRESLSRLAGQLLP